MPLGKAFFVIKKKIFAKEEGKFFSSNLGETKEMGTTKEQTKKRGFETFFFFHVSKQKQMFCDFSFWSQQNKNF